MNTRLISEFGIRLYLVQKLLNCLKVGIWVEVCQARMQASFLNSQGIVELTLTNYSLVSFIIS